MNPSTLKSQLATAAAVGLLAPLLSGCFAVNARAGVGTAPAMVYKRTITPMYYNKDYSIFPQENLSFSDLNRTIVSTHRAGVNIPFVLPPGASTILTVGWGDMSFDKAQKAEEFPDIVYMDARETDVLGVYQRIDLMIYHRGELAEPFKRPESFPASRPQ